MWRKRGNIVFDILCLLNSQTSDCDRATVSYRYSLRYLLPNDGNYLFTAIFMSLTGLATSYFYQMRHFCQVSHKSLQSFQSGPNCHHQKLPVRRNSRPAGCSEWTVTGHKYVVPMHPIPSSWAHPVRVSGCPSWIQLAIRSALGKHRKTISPANRLAGASVAATLGWRLSCWRHQRWTNVEADCQS